MSASLSGFRNSICQIPNSPAALPGGATGLSPRFEDLSFPAILFHHREHIHVAWLYLKSSKPITRRRAHVRRYSPVRESPWRNAEIHQHTHAGLDAPGCRALVETRRDTRLSSSSPPIRSCWTWTFSPNIIRKSSFAPRPPGKPGCQRPQPLRS